MVQRGLPTRGQRTYSSCLSTGQLLHRTLLLALTLKDGILFEKAVGGVAGPGASYYISIGDVQDDGSVMTRYAFTVHRDLLDAPTALAACCGFDRCHEYILYLYFTRNK
jgi:hypothetical protein